MREFLFALALLVASAFVVVGAAHWSHGVAWVVAGVLLALIAWLVLGGEVNVDRHQVADERLEVES